LKSLAAGPSAQSASICSIRVRWSASAAKPGRSQGRFGGRPAFANIMVALISFTEGLRQHAAE
jgi:hypothetical protein